MITRKNWIVGAVLALGVGSMVTSAAFADKGAKALQVAPNTTKKLSGDLKAGKKIDLAWATKSSVACFPSVQNKHFDGKHVFYEMDLPAKSVLKIKAKPKKAGTDISLYAFSVGTTSKVLPPNVTSVVSCEASYGSKSLSAPFNPGKAETVELNATTNPYRVVIGVAGAEKLKTGSFSLEIDLKTAAPPPAGKITEATPLVAKSGKTIKAKGKINKGKQIDLAWAANSSVACFPATENDNFDGNHVAFKFDLPKYHTAKVELIPKKSTTDLSLYAYSMGTTRNDLPPDVPSVVSCEASYGSNSISSPYNPGATEDVELVAINNPYTVVVGVAGAQKLKKGEFDLKVTLTPR